MWSEMNEAGKDRDLQHLFKSDQVKEKSFMELGVAGLYVILQNDGSSFCTHAPTPNHASAALEWHWGTLSAIWPFLILTLANILE